MKRSEELLKVGDEMASRLIEGLESARSRGGKRKAQREHKTELSRFRLLVDMIEKGVSGGPCGVVPRRARAD